MLHHHRYAFTLEPSLRLAKRSGADREAPRFLPCVLLAMTLATGAATMPQPAFAVDGCTVLLCLAAPSWRAIPQCVPPIRQLFKDLARGRVFPSCGMAGLGNGSSHAWAQAPSFCPPQYTREFDGPRGPIYRCDYDGAVEVKVEGQSWARTWWSMGGDTVTEFMPAAKAKLGTWDSKFEDDYTAWLANPPPPPCPFC
jgi:hypothetical protein